MSGKSTRPMSSSSRTSPVSGTVSSGLSVFLEVVPRMVMEPCGTKISPSDALRRRLITRLVKRWLKATSVPRSGLTLMVRPAVRAISPTQLPAALTTKAQGMTPVSPVRVSRTLTPVTAPFALLTAVTSV